MFNKKNLFTYDSFKNYHEYLHHTQIKKKISSFLYYNIHSQKTQLIQLTSYISKYDQKSEHLYSQIDRFHHKIDIQLILDSIFSRQYIQLHQLAEHFFYLYRIYNKLLQLISQFLFFTQSIIHICKDKQRQQKKQLFDQLLTIINAYIYFKPNHENLIILTQQMNKINQLLAIEKKNKKKQIPILENIIHYSSIKFIMCLKVYHNVIINFLALIIQFSDNQCNNQLQNQLIFLQKLETNYAKIHLCILIDQYINQKSQLLYKCLNCQLKFKHCKLLKHIQICQKKFKFDQLLQQNFNLLLPKLLDLNAASINIQRIFNQNKKQIIHSQKNLNRKSKFFLNRQLSKTTDYDLIKKNQFDDSLSSDDQIIVQNMHTPIQKKIKKIQQLSQIQLNQLIKIIEKLQDIGQKIKKSRQSSNILVFYELRDVKNHIQKGFNLISVDCPEIKTIISLFLIRYSYIQILKRNNYKAKQSGLDTDEQYLSLQNIQVPLIYTQPYKPLKFPRKKYKQAQDNYFSEQQKISVKNNFFQNQPVKLNQFQIIKSLGSGAYSTVYLVKKKSTGEKYAMKKIKIQNFKQYYQTKKMSQHLENQQCIFSIIKSPYVVKAFYSFSENQYHYFIIEYCLNGDFSDLLKNQVRLTQIQSKLYLAQIVQALDYLHKLQIIHRDLKPQNILIDQKWHIKLTDYGLSDAGIKNKTINFQKSRNLSKFALQSRKNIFFQKKQKKIVGSPYYMAPEILLGQPATYYSDWWSFGILMYQTLIGIVPFDGDRNQIQQKIFKRELWPQDMEFGYGQDMISYQAKDLIQKLLIIQPMNRIGKDVMDIRYHKFFDGIDWSNLLLMDGPKFEMKQSTEKVDLIEIQGNDINLDSFSETKLSKSFSRQYQKRGDLLNIDTKNKYIIRQSLYQKLRIFSGSIKKKISNL